jgi:hypothetical protein
MITVGLLLLPIVLVTPARAGLDCDAVLARCQATPSRCQAGKLKRCVRQGIAVCATPTTTTTTTLPEFCSRCPTARCRADGMACQECTPNITVVVECQQITEHYRNQCCTRFPPQPDPLPIDCATIPVRELTFLCGHYLPPQHGCCAQP